MTTVNRVITSLRRGTRLRQDAVVNLAGFNWRQAPLLANLNIGSIRILASSAQLAQPDQITQALTTLNQAKTLVQLHQAMIEGVKIGLLAFTEAKITNPLESFDPDLMEHAKTRENDIRVLSQKCLDTNEIDCQVMQYETEAFDALTGQQMRFTITVNHTVFESHKFTTVYADLPWHSPNIVRKLNEFFGSTWLYKRAQRFIIEEGDEKKSSYIWGQYNDVPSSSSLSTSWLLIKKTIEDPRWILRGTNIDLERVDQEIEGLNYQEAVPALLVEQLQHSIDSFSATQWAKTATPGFYWDLGLAINLQRR